MWITDAMYPEVDVEMVSVLQCAHHVAVYLWEFKFKLEKVLMAKCKIVILQSGYGDFYRNETNFYEFWKSLVTAIERKHPEVEVLILGLLPLVICKGSLTGVVQKNLMLRELCA